MTTIDQIIQQEPNPFDAETFWSGNFWQEDQNPEFVVESIHQEAIKAIGQTLDLISQDHRTRTLMLEGETGSGKTYLLGRLRRMLNPKAFFVYIEPFTASDYIWRHILRYTVDSLLEVPAGEQDSQLILWLKGLWGFKQRGLLDWLRGERLMVIKNLRAIYPAGIYNANEFFGVLYDLTNPKLKELACEWLRGDDLDEEQLKLLHVQHSIDTEDAAQKILANFGRIAAESKPIVLCFDQIDNIARLSDGHIDLQSLFSVNSVIHNQKLKNFLVIISIITDTWRQNAHRIQPTDKDRVDASIVLKKINLYEAETLWKSRLNRLYLQANPRPVSSIYPLSRDILEIKFPGGKTRPRNTLMLGRKLFQDYKLSLMENGHAVSRQNAEAGAEPLEILQAELIVEDSRPWTVPTLEALADEADAQVEKNGSNLATTAAFKLVWLRKFNQTVDRISRIRQYSSPELVTMLAEAIAAIQPVEIQPRFLSSSRTYASYSLSYQLSGKSTQVGVVWSEDLNMVKFCNLMKVCQEAIAENLCQNFYLIRSESVGNPTNQGYQLHQKLFSQPQHIHIIPALNSVHYLVTYHGLVNDAIAGELVVGDTTPNLAELESLIRESNILSNCQLLQELSLISVNSVAADPDNLLNVQEFILNRLMTQQCIARQRLIEESRSQFSPASESQVQGIIDRLCQENEKINILDPNAKIEEQLIYFAQ
ncbi:MULTISPECIES: P-loop NTPase fold protein [Planktothricoides]|uniref:P-loop NTPase fold protein n=2 Tax=Planktothricoides raciborskii TaxID=132608 RepID=A0AAU8J8K8_9CYAN|nr:MULTISPECIES: P-loop NTPase fold protein [Planktothricoides]KOR34476.1 KAP family P-loop domain-containing protein [Planktothricoides sp. SR001]MBD2546588.1 ATP-binding protein [Planktothricoides raciborskii FACHB-1370]MBD2584992.1 ATP-binding protein [Planktothricoides raciborskii FACHB-1261]